MNFWHSIILGIVEGLTEFLPISSTFHLIVTSKILGLTSTDFLKLFEVFIQSGAIFALVFIYAQSLLGNRKLLQSTLIAFIPTAVIGAILYKVIKGIFFESDWLMLAVFVLVGILFLVLEKYLATHKIVLGKTTTDLTTRDSLIVGLVQAVSVIPGVSRAGSVIVVMMLMGYKRDEAAKFTFLLSLPTIIGASTLDLYQSRQMIVGMGNGWMLLAVGFFVSLIVAYFVVRWLTHYLSTHTLEIFGWYRLVVAAFLIAFKVLP
jgi:undecaprenyl-diphosphatase